MDEQFFNFKGLRGAFSGRPVLQEAKSTSRWECFWNVAKRTPTVSVVIRTYNRAHSVGEAIRSALEQTYSHFEIIVVDDGSTDATAEVLRSFGDRRVRVVRHECNRGVGAACNTGIAEASGDFVAWLDSDDVWFPEKLGRQVEFLRRHREIDAVFSDVCVREQDGDVPSLIEHIEAFQKCLEGKKRGSEVVISQREMYLCLLQEVPIKPTALMLRRSVFPKTGMFDERAHSGEDWEFLLRLARFASFGYIDQPLARMTRSADSTFDRFRLEDKAFLLRVFKRERERLRQDGEAFNTARRGLFHHFKRLGFCYVEAGRPSKAAATYLEGFEVTHDGRLILQAGAAFIPVSLRKALMSVRASRGNLRRGG
jgi:glycosyltransferase involved in cell wall biosynthesis